MRSAGGHLPHRYCGRPDHREGAVRGKLYNVSKSLVSREISIPSLAGDSGMISLGPNTIDLDMIQDLGE